MESRDVINLNWKKFTNWSGLNATWYDEEQQKSFVWERDIDLFLENIYQDLSLKLQIPYEHLVPIMVSRNMPFHMLKHKLFENLYTPFIDKNDAELAMLQNLLNIPDTRQIGH